MTGSAPDGWYHARGDPEGSVRFWNGTAWIEGPTAGVPTNGLPPVTTTLLDAPPHTYVGSTPEPMVHGRVLADAGRRVGAAIIDSIVAVLFSIPLLIASIDGSPMESRARTRSPPR